MRLNRRSNNIPTEHQGNGRQSFVGILWGLLSPRLHGYCQSCGGFLQCRANPGKTLPCCAMEECDPIYPKMRDIQPAWNNLELSPREPQHVGTHTLPYFQEWTLTALSLGKPEDRWQPYNCQLYGSQGNARDPGRWKRLFGIGPAGGSGGLA